MFTIAAFFAIAGLAWYARSANNGERESVSTFDDDLVRQSVVFAREDLKLITLALAAILVMLGIIADRLG
jgi:hypothetical protein